VKTCRNNRGQTTFSAIDDVEYNTDNLSPEALQQLQMLQVTEQELARLNAQLAITQTARIAYANA
jgi:hypothetical protein